MMSVRVRTNYFRRMTKAMTFQEQIDSLYDAIDNLNAKNVALVSAIETLAKKLNLDPQEVLDMSIVEANS